MTSIAAADAPPAFDAIASNKVSKQLVFIDTAVKDFLFLVRGVYPQIPVVLLYPHRDGVEQITRTLAHRSNIEAIHIVSPGEPGRVQLGGANLTIDSIASYTEPLWQWRRALAPDAEILIYGCRVAIDPAIAAVSVALLNRLHALTGAQVAASSHPTGNAALGGNWELDVSTGEIFTPLAFPPQVRNAYSGILA
ncbi:DUF4347 domain-containing protein [Microcoleus sp. FACHB-1515]|uniref:DUF4347 domain-containing protein n=1 Tax=Cyanophyceae TaxID=3028117 RepID=UPI001686E8A9|nr:DUF4347 domain-containing protein [Microcoleus sp. FACHB-1515]MBD2088910.1 DUF4347 domain-containing protein [Microcoleus sp. FACHB-1515]